MAQRSCSPCGGDVTVGWNLALFQSPAMGGCSWAIDIFQIRRINLNVPITELAAMFNSVKVELNRASLVEKCFIVIVIYVEEKVYWVKKFSYFLLKKWDRGFEENIKPHRHTHIVRAIVCSSMSPFRALYARKKSQLLNHWKHINHAEMKSFHEFHCCWTLYTIVEWFTEEISYEKWIFMRCALTNVSLMGCQSCHPWKRNAIFPSLMTSQCHCSRTSWRSTE